MAHKKGGGSSKNGRDSNAQRLGIKRFGGQNVLAGEVSTFRKLPIFGCGAKSMKVSSKPPKISIFKSFINGEITSNE